jgi:plasmid stabilization system protein ParE
LPKQNFAVVGTARNVAKSIEQEIRSIKKALDPLGNIYFHLIESDSVDSTVQVLQRLKETIPNFDFTALGELRQDIPDRIERLIFCRNAYVIKLRELIEELNIQTVAVADLDGMNTKLHTKSIEQAAKNLSDWSAICANQMGRYYDLLALRHKYWCPNNVFDEYRWLGRFMDLKHAKNLAIYNRMIRIPVNSGTIEVDSAFGGFALYRAQIFLYCDYSRQPHDSPSDIDHVILTRRIRESGGRICIDSNLINGGWNEHSLASLGTFRLMVSLKNSLKNLLSSLVKKFHFNF